MLEAVGWMTTPTAQEARLGGLLSSSGCGSHTPCGSGAACDAFGRVMGLALGLLAVVRSPFATDFGGAGRQQDM